MAKKAAVHAVVVDVVYQTDGFLLKKQYAVRAVSIFVS